MAIHFPLFASSKPRCPAAFQYIEKGLLRATLLLPWVLNPAKLSDLLFL